MSSDFSTVPLAQSTLAARQTRRTLAAVAGLLLLIAPAACSRDSSTASVPPPATPTSPPTPTIPIAAPPSTIPTTIPGLPPMQFETIDMTIKDKPFKIEIADSDAKEERGLMNRSSMPADHGMLFVFNKPDTYSFWMKNTLIPLDIIFLDSTGKVLIIDQRQPMDETGHGPSTPALYVIELNVGMANVIGLKVGDSVAIPAKYLKTTQSPTEK